MSRRQAAAEANAWSHVALGQSYKSALRGAASMSRRELEAVGFNASAVHTDVMFGSPEVSVVATKSRQGEVTFIERGRWTAPFAGGSRG